ncbi:fimbrial protein [Klebsiella variicola]|uniref:fimbrial protein n=1 Tax=Klebsiella variicola TaxID=244366 RepID=UPI0033AAF7CD
MKISFERMTSGASDGFMDVDSTVANAAQNVGVEVRDNNNTLLKFSSDYTYTSSSVSNKELTLPMTARYKAATTVGNIGPGTANTGMTVTIDQD